VSQDSAVGIATGYWLDKRGQSLSPGRVKDFLYVVQTGSGTHQDSSLMSIGVSFLGSNAAGA
jgi:hypothetical protein